MAAVTVASVTKSFGKVQALQGVDFEIAEGEVFGLLGPNGAGKTTLIRILATLSRSDAGACSVAGLDVAKDPAGVRQRIGLVFQEPSLDTLLTGRENLVLSGRLYGMDRPSRDRRIREMLELVELSARSDHQVKTYSGGMKRRLELARGLLHEPRVLFLDEPTLGLDPQSRGRLWEYIRKLKAAGTTVLLTTHYMEEADALCDRVAIIDKGRIVRLGTPQRLKEELGQTVVRLRQREPTPETFRKLDFVARVDAVDGDLVLSLTGGVNRLHEIVQVAGALESLEVRTPTLQDVFLHHTGRDLRDAGETGEDWSDEVARMAFSGSGDNR